VGPWSGVKVERPQRSEDERPRGRRGSAAHSRGSGGRGKDVVVQVISLPPCENVAMQETSVGRAGAQPYLGPRTVVRRHDDGWGARRAGWKRGAAAQSLREVHPTARWRQETCGSRPRASA